MDRARVLSRPTRLELGLAFGSIGLIALHVLDDNFLQPQPGTSAGDHLLSGLVPLAVLIGVAAIYPRVRAGARAAIALLLGLLAFALGSEAVYYSMKDGPSGDDYTGLLSILAGLVLVGVAVWTLWRTRRLDDSRPRRYLRRFLLAAAAFLVLYGIVGPFAISYVFTHVARTKTASGNLGAPYEQVAFTTSDGLKLKGWYVPSKNRAAVVVFPGRKGTQKHARMLVKHGYGVLVFDRRGEGESDGDPITLGWTFPRDLEGAAAFLRKRSDVDRNRIGGIGLSVGGEALLQTAAESDAYNAVVSEGAGARSHRELLDSDKRSKWLELPGLLVMTAGTALFSNAGPPPSIKDLTPRISPTPAFFIYAGHGQGGEDLNPKYYAAAHEPKQIWKIPEASHTHGLSTRPAEYERRVVGFFDRNLR